MSKILIVIEKVVGFVANIISIIYYYCKIETQYEKQFKSSLENFK